MAGCGDGEWCVSTWGRYVDEDGDVWRRWSVRFLDRRLGFLELPESVDSAGALVQATQGFDPLPG